MLTGCTGLVSSARLQGGGLSLLLSRHDYTIIVVDSLLTCGLTTDLRIFPPGTRTVTSRFNPVPHVLWSIKQWNAGNGAILHYNVFAFLYVMYVMPNST